MAETRKRWWFAFCPDCMRSGRIMCQRLDRKWGTRLFFSSQAVGDEVQGLMNRGKIAPDESEDVLYGLSNALLVSEDVDIKYDELCPRCHQEAPATGDLVLEDPGSESPA